MYDFLFVIIEHFSLALTVGMLQAEICQREQFLKGGWVTSIAHFRWKGTSPTNHCWVAENYKDCPFIWYKNIAGSSFGLVTKHMCDRRTDGQNYDSQDHASIASCGKNHSINWNEASRGGLTRHPSMLRSKVRHQCDNPNCIKFIPGNGGAITVRLANNSTQSILAQVTAGPHRPWYSTEYIFVANMPHKTFYENIWELKFKA